MKKGMLIFLCMVFCLAFPKSVSAEEIVSRETDLQVMFVLDCSGSMKSNDPSRTAVRMVQAFIDSVNTENLSVGYLAYNDTVLSSSGPVSIADPDKRQQLKDAIERIPYAGDTDIGLGLSQAYEQMSAEPGEKRILVLISDGETDLKAGGNRTIGQSNTDLESCVELCQEEGTSVYTIAFGEYDGNAEVLQEIAEQTGGESYTAEVPEKLIDVLYGILGKDAAYQIQQFSSGIYADGIQEVRCTLDEPYLDEIDVLLISEKEIGETFLKYGSDEISMTKLSNYAVGKIDQDQIDDTIHELTVHVSTSGKQNLRMFLIGYRKLVPVFQTETDIYKNQTVPYWICFRDRDGSVIRDEAFYKRFQWRLECAEEEAMPLNIPDRLETDEGILKGTIQAERSGSCTMSGLLFDDLGEYTFQIPLTVSNHPPTGDSPQIMCRSDEKERSFDLRPYFKDADGDRLLFALAEGEQDTAGLSLTEEGILNIFPVKTGVQAAVLMVSDGEDTFTCSLQVSVVSVWKLYGWIVPLVLAAVLAAGYLIRKRLTEWKSDEKSEIEQIAEEKKDHCFCGKLDAYFTMLPEGEEEIPPLSFPLHRVKDNKIILGDLLQRYPKTVDVLGLDEICLIADEERRMILYHQSDAEVMIGSTIVCRRLRYHVSFGDVIYITSEDGMYDLEIHYIAVYL